MKRQMVLKALVSVALIVTTLGQTSIQTPALASAPTHQVISETPASSPPPALVQGWLVDSAHVDPALDAPPSAAEATVTDRNNPAWQVHYGTQAGRNLIPPRSAPQALTTSGPQAPLSGAWLTMTLQTGTALPRTHTSPSGPPPPLRCRWSMRRRRPWTR